ncbi:corrinoid protein [Fontisphaera persica]|uniref:cobalamin B12-binding domain-containing protein n=1 Tax=Fontisphaera persica TaxID=2974023 RepID=UPI0024BF8825|nr:corrinoid protein [Fontisphaera persica]WCJ57964.1 corrinoid protein [Fontisphaera persica]
MQNFQPLFDAIVSGNAAEARTLTQKYIAENVNQELLVKDCIIPAMSEVGRRFECNEYFVPELLLANRAMKECMKLLSSSGPKVGRVVIGTVKGDLHDIGKNLVAAMLEGGGFEVVDLGVNVAPEKFIEAVKAKNAQIVAMSALLTTTMTAMQATIDAFKQAGLRDQVKFLIGGAPITQKYADEIGADGYSDNAVGAVSLAQKVLSR